MFNSTIRPRFWLLGALALALSALMGTILLTGSGAAPAAAPAAQPAAVTFEPAGHFGGWLAAIAVPAAGNYLYLGEGSGFTVYDVTDKAHPRQVAGLPLDGTDVSGIALTGDMAYLANGAGLRVVSLANPVKPALLGGLDLAGAEGVALVGNTAYVAGGQAGLLIVDVSNPLSPTLRGTYNTPGNAQKVQVVGSMAYVADGTSGLQIVDVSNPAIPTLLGAYDTPGEALDVQVVGSTAYVADWSKGLQIINVSNPVSPTRLGFYDTPGYARDVEVVGTLAYVADHNGGLQILNVSNPASPTLLTTVDGGWRANVVRVSGSTAYVGSSEKGLRVLDVSNPAAPVVLGSYERPSVLFDMAVAGTDLRGFRNLEGLATKYAYAVSQFEFWTLDMTEPSLPRPVGKTALDNGIYARVAASGTLAYVAQEDSGLQIISAADPFSPTLISRYAPPGGARPRDVAVHGPYAYVPTVSYVAASGAAGGWTDGWLRVVDVSNPISPTLAASFDTPGDARRVVVAPHAATGKTIAYVADGPAGLRIVDVSNPRAPVGLSVLPPPTAAATTTAVFVAGNYAFVGSNAASGWRIQKVDVTNPLSPTVAAETRSETGAITDLTGAGDHLYVGGSLHVFSMTDLASLFRLAGPSVENVTAMAEGMAEYIYALLASGGMGGWFSLSCSVATIVFPPEAAANGCAVSPPAQPCECGSEEPFPLGFTACTDWAFRFFLPETLVCPNEGTAQTIGYFTPKLTTAGGGRTAFCYDDGFHKFLTVLRFTLTASNADDWKVSSVTLQAFGDGDDAADVDSVHIEPAGYPDSGGLQYRQDNGAITYEFDEITIPRGETQAFSVEYKMKPIHCATAPREYGVSITHNARPVTWPPGWQLGSAAGSLKLGCVKTQPAYIEDGEGLDVFETVQQGVNAAGAGMTVVVCEGAYSENVQVGQPLIIRGQFVGDQPVVAANNPNQHTFTIGATGVTLNGLDVRGATGRGSAGVYAAGDVNLTDMLINGNADGVFAAGSPQISGSRISDNTHNGVYGRGGVTARDVKVLHSGGHGIWSDAGNLLLTNVEASSNGGWGITTQGNVILQGTSANEFMQNELGGIRGGTIAATHVIAKGNRGPGIEGDTINISQRALVEENTGFGMLAADSITGGLLQVRRNADTGIYCLGGIDISLLDASNNGGYGVFAHGPIRIVGHTGEISGNRDGGGVASPGLVQVRDISASGNHGAGIAGAVVAAEGVGATNNAEEGIRGQQSIQAAFLVASGNGKEGLLAANGNILGQSVFSFANTSHGIRAGGGVNLVGSGITNNQGYGIVYGGSLVVKAVEITGNTLGATSGPTGTVTSAGVLAGPLASSVSKSAIARNLGDGLRPGPAEALTIRQSNIYGNTGYGVNNLAGATVDAAGNWWGDPSGPGGAGPGTGDEITGTVAYTPWLTSMVGLVVGSASDPVYAGRGATASTRVYVQDWVHPTSTVTLTLSDTQGWLHPPLSVTAALSGTGAVVPITFTAPSAAPLGATDRVTITATSGSDPAARDTASFQIIAALLADLAVDKWSDPPIAAPGEPLTYTITVANHGPDPAAQVVLTDTLPLTVTFSSAAPSQGTCQGSGPVVCALGALPPAGVVTVTLVVTPSAIGRVENTATATAGEVDPQPWNNAAAVTTEVRIPMRPIYLPLALR